MRFLATILPMVVLMAITAQVNHHLAPLQVSVLLAGILVAWTALRVPGRTSLAGLLFCGLWLDASSPVPFGTHAACLAVAYLVILRLRERLPRDETLVGILVALFTNLGIFLAISLQRAGDSPDAASAWLRLLADLLASQIVIALIAPWFFALQERTFRLFRFRFAP